MTTLNNKCITKVYKNIANVQLSLDIYNFALQGSNKAVIYLHPGSFMNCDSTQILAERHSGVFEKLIANNYVVVSINYRLINENNKFGDNLQDCIDGINWVYDHASEYHIDRHNIGLWGASAGGTLSLLSSLKVKFKVKYIVNEYGLLEFDKWLDFEVSQMNQIELKHYALKFFRINIDELMVNGSINNELVNNLVKKYSPISYIAQYEMPILTLHGTADNKVGYQQALNFDIAFKRNKKNNHELISYEGQGHKLNLINDSDKIYKTNNIFNFIENNS